jgi:hypothetical protein
VHSTRQEPSCVRHPSLSTPTCPDIDIQCSCAPVTTITWRVSSYASLVPKLFLPSQSLCYLSERGADLCHSLGQFNATSIRLSFITTVYPALILAYLGQGARLIVDGDTVITNVFYTSIPGKANGPLFWIIYVWAILATVRDPSCV